MNEEGLRGGIMCLEKNYADILKQSLDGKMMRFGILNQLKRLGYVVK